MGWAVAVVVVAAMAAEWRAAVGLAAVAMAAAAMGQAGADWVVDLAAVDCIQQQGWVEGAAVAQMVNSHPPDALQVWWQRSLPSMRRRR